MKNISLIIGILLLIIFFGMIPLLIIWALNTLFPVLEIAYTPDSWFALFILQGLLLPNAIMCKSK